VHECSIFFVHAEQSCHASLQLRVAAASLLDVRTPSLPRLDLQGGIKNRSFI
jgi:hypothetical protein